MGPYYLFICTLTCLYVLLYSSHAFNYTVMKSTTILPKPHLCNNLINFELPDFHIKVQLI